MKKYFIYYIFLPALFTNCIEENIEPIIPKYHNSADLATYLELNRNFINSENNPALVNVYEVNNNLSNYLIIDIREASEFVIAHIPNSKNVPPDDILSFLESIELDEYAKVVIVCENGDHSGYVTSLLRMLGYENVYSLNFGLGYWNETFSQPWIDARTMSRTKGWFNNSGYKKRDVYSKLPQIEFLDNEALIEDKLKSRIQKLLEINFDDFTITQEEFDNLYSYKHRSYTDRFIICYGDKYLYDSLYISYINVAPPPDWGGHPRTAVLFNPLYDFYLSSNILTIPPEENIIIYSYNGQRSAYILAYLKLLGYNVKIIEFGAYSLLSKLFKEPKFFWNPKDNIWIGPYFYWSHASPYGFWEEFIQDYPIETGQ